MSVPPSASAGASGSVTPPPSPPPAAARPLPPPEPPLTRAEIEAAAFRGARRATLSPVVTEGLTPPSARTEVVPIAAPVAPAPPPPPRVEPVATVAPVALQPDAPQKAPRQPVTAEQAKRMVYTGIILVLALFLAWALLVMGYRFLSGDPVIPQKATIPIPATLAPAPASVAPATLAPAPAPASLTKAEWIQGCVVSARTAKNLDPVILEQRCRARASTAP